jgi:hypothetical protein
MNFPSVMATLGFCRALLGDLWANVHCVKHLCLCAGWFLKAYLRVGQNKPQSFSALLQFEEGKKKNINMVWQLLSVY